MEITFLNKIEEESWISIIPDKEDIKINIIPNKLFRILSKKNIICASLDKLLVDLIKEKLENAAKEEEELELEVQDGNRKSKSFNRSKPESGQSRDKASRSFI